MTGVRCLVLKNMPNGQQVYFQLLTGFEYTKLFVFSTPGRVNPIHVVEYFSSTTQPFSYRINIQMLITSLNLPNLSSI